MGQTGDEGVERKQGRPGDRQMPGEAGVQSYHVQVVTARPWGCPTYLDSGCTYDPEDVFGRCPDFSVPWGTSLLGKSPPLYVLQFPYL